MANAYQSHLGRARTAGSGAKVNYMTHGITSKRNEGAAAAFSYNITATPVARVRHQQLAQSDSITDFNLSFGTVRASMKNNIHFQKPELGKTRPTAPHIVNATHGVQTYRSTSVADTMRWFDTADTLPPRRSPGPRSPPRANPALGEMPVPVSRQTLGWNTLGEVDALALNRMSVSHGMVSTNDFQKLKNIAGGSTLKSNVSLLSSKSKTCTPRSLPPSHNRETVYGAKSIPSDAVADLVTFKAFHEAQQTKLARAHQPVPAKTYKSTTNRATVLRAKVHEPEPQPYWRIARFMKTAPATQSFRSSESRANARVNYERDSQARLGTNFHHGIYRMGERGPI